MAISASMVKELREKTGAGMMDCKKALTETDGAMDEAVQYLKEKGLAKAAKKAGRSAADGAVLIDVDNEKHEALMVELNCETDFAAKSEGFVALSKQVLEYFKNNAKEENSVVEMESFYNSDVEEMITNAIAKIGENIKPRRFVKFTSSETSLLHSYLHMGGKIGVVVEINAEAPIAGNSDVVEMADGIAMQIASMKPECVSSDEFPQDKIEAERAAFKAQVIEMGKPENIADKIVDGKIKKFVAENTLLEQAFVMNGDLKVKDYVKETGAKVGTELAVSRFVRFELGEGVEKKEDNFAEEVAAQLKK